MTATPKKNLRWFRSLNLPNPYSTSPTLTPPLHQVLKSDNVLDLKGSLADTFVSTYQQNSEMAAVDVVYCSYPASLCQIYLRLNKSVLVHASTRWAAAVVVVAAVAVVDTVVAVVAVVDIVIAAVVVVAAAAIVVVDTVVAAAGVVVVDGTALAGTTWEGTRHND